MVRSIRATGNQPRQSSETCNVKGRLPFGLLAVVGLFLFLVIGSSDMLLGEKKTAELSESSPVIDHHQLILSSTSAHSHYFLRTRLSQDRDIDLSALDEMVQQGISAMSSQSWRHAEDLFNKALLNGADKNDYLIREGLEWCTANAAVEKRYSDTHLASYIRSLESDYAEGLLVQIIDLVEREYYQPLEEHALLNKTLLQLHAAVENEVVCRHFSVEKDALLYLQDAIRIYRVDELMNESGRLRTCLEISQSLRKLSENAGLGAAWPAMELASGLVDSLDRYSYMLSPNQYEGLRDQLGGHYVGTGVDLLFDGDFPVVFDVVEGSPAARSGLKPGDFLIRVAGENCQWKSSGELSGLLLGEAHTSVEITYQRDEKEYTTTVERGIVVSPSVRYSQMLKNSVGYFRISTFDDDTAMEMKRCIDQLRQKGAESLVIDLRGNGGGVMRSAIDAVRLFVNQGPIVTVYTADDATKYTASGEKFVCYSMPIAILVDKKTASASEIFAAALQDHHRGIIIGEQTLGKGVVQTIFELRTGKNAICITTAHYLPPSKRDFQGIGLKPDIVLETALNSKETAVSMKSYLDENNPVLSRALIELNSNVLVMSTDHDRVEYMNLSEKL